MRNKLFVSIGVFALLFVPSMVQAGAEGGGRPATLRLSRFDRGKSGHRLTGRIRGGKGRFTAGQSFDALGQPLDASHGALPPAGSTASVAKRVLQLAVKLQGIFNQFATEGRQPTADVSNVEALVGQLCQLVRSKEFGDIFSPLLDDAGASRIVEHDVVGLLTGVCLAAECLRGEGQQADFSRALASRSDARLKILRHYLNPAVFTARPARLVAAMMALVPTAEAHHDEGSFVTEGSIPNACLAIRPSALALILDNLLGNAIKYKQPERPLKVVVSGTVNGGEGVMELTIRDNGRGIQKDALEEVFDLGGRDKASTDAQLGGSHGLNQGMGLYTVRQLVEAAGGSVVATSEDGEGSAFVLKLPLLERSRRRGVSK